MNRHLARASSVLNRRRVAATVAAVLAVGAVSGFAYAETSGSAGSSSQASGVAQAASSPPSTQSPANGGSSPARPGAKAGAAGLLKRAIHVEAILPDPGGSGYRVVDVDRGTVGAISASSITVNRPDGKSVTATVNSSTRFGAGSPPSVGEQVVLMQSNGTAVRVAARPATGSAPTNPAPGSSSGGGAGVFGGTAGGAGAGAA
jgi:uncharacterized membrane protein